MPLALPSVLLRRAPLLVSGLPSLKPGPTPTIRGPTFIHYVRSPRHPRRHGFSNQDRHARRTRHAGCDGQTCCDADSHDLVFVLALEHGSHGALTRIVRPGEALIALLEIQVRMPSDSHPYARQSYRRSSYSRRGRGLEGEKDAEVAEE